MSFSELISPLIGRFALAWFFLSEVYTRAGAWEANVSLMTILNIPAPPLLFALALIVMILGGIVAPARLSCAPTARCCSSVSRWSQPWSCTITGISHQSRGPRRRLRTLRPQRRHRRRIADGDRTGRRAVRHRQQGRQEKTLGQSGAVGANRIVDARAARRRRDRFESASGFSGRPRMRARSTGPGKRMRPGATGANPTRGNRTRRRRG